MRVGCDRLWAPAWAPERERLRAGDLPEREPAICHRRLSAIVSPDPRPALTCVEFPSLISSPPPRRQLRQVLRRPIAPPTCAQSLPPGCSLLYTLSWSQKAYRSAALFLCPHSLRQPGSHYILSFHHPSGPSLTPELAKTPPLTYTHITSTPLP
ncbi:hypothetical protein K474DRAFT_414697 [Panus rudis PR-1116 ss-1]|nr:hypothetical protein K474DRAFT_414697 [Panus rudis PR-1116 ss-1]